MKPSGLVRWQRVLQQQARQIQAQWPSRPAAPKPGPGGLQAGFMYSGQLHESVPRQLLLDNRLTPLERNAWQVIRLLIDDQGLSTPRYEDLQAYLSSVPYGTAASRETIARILTLLRLTRWLSLVIRGRDPVSGRLQGSLYVLHDEPLTPAEALELDAGYLELVGSGLSHASKAVRIVAEHVIEDIRQDTDIDQSRLPTRLEAWGERCARQAAGRTPEQPVIHESERGDPRPVRIRASPGSDSEPSRKSGSCHPVRHPNAASTVLDTNTGICISTVPHSQVREGGGPPLDWPDSLNLSPAERLAAQQALGKLPAGDRQTVLAEAGARCAAGGIRKPAAYLMSLIQRALQGEFHPWAAAPVSQPAADRPQRPVEPVRFRRSSGDPIPTQVQACLEELRKLGRSHSGKQ